MKVLFSLQPKRITNSKITKSIDQQCKILYKQHGV